ncbi:hypothetical protein HAX54_033327 [Datura stramonium]|uniref:Late blight resistance protein R1A-like N-terminal domain-containing protein n=1 Tax=Datura stramonium TaxID=4076 RepID=A0ABS8SDI5_DATST|nr:hypothetical protein [Datura stramonium]
MMSLDETLEWIEEEWGSLKYTFEHEYPSSEKSHPLETMQLIEEDSGSSGFKLEYLTKKDVFKCRHLKVVPSRFEDSSSLKSVEIISCNKALARLAVELRETLIDVFGTSGFEVFIHLTSQRHLTLVVSLQSFANECPDVTDEVQSLFQDATTDLSKLYNEQVRPWSQHFYHSILRLQYKIWRTRSGIRSKYYFPEISLQLFDKNDVTVIPNSMMKFMDTTVENLSYLLNDPSLPICSWGHFEKALKELKFLRNFVCFVSGRRIDTRSQHTFFINVLAVVGQITMFTWLFLPSPADRNEDLPENMDVLLSDLQRRIQPIEPCICKIYTSVLQALKLMQSQWEMVKFLIANLLNLSIRGLEFHPQHIDSVIVDVGLLVYSLNDNKEKEKEDMALGEVNQVPVLDFPAVKIQRLQAMVYVITRKSFLLQFNLPGVDELVTVDIVIDNLKEILCHSSDSIVSVKRQIQKIQKEFRCFQAAVEQHDELQHFATRVIGLAYEIEYLVDACTKEEIPD